MHLSFPALRNTFARLTREKRLRIVVVGNSVTYGAPAGAKRNPSFYVAMADWLRGRFPDAEIEVKTKIIFAMGPEVQVFYMDRNVLPERPDLVLAEFNAANGAANSGWKENGPPLTEAAAEGFIRRLRLCLPEADCFLQLALHESMLADFRAGRDPLSSSFLKTAAAHYNCAYADAAQAVAGRILAGEPWAGYMDDGIHPGAKGYEVYSRELVNELARQWALFQKLPESERVVRPHAFPESSLTPEPWLFPRLVPAAFFGEYDGSFVIREDGPVKYIAANRAGASGRFRVHPPARIVGIAYRKPEAPPGNLEIRVGGEWKRLSQREPRFHEESDIDRFFYRTFFGPNQCPPSMESVEFRVSDQPENPGAFAIELFGFFVFERPAAIPFRRA